MPLEAVPDTLPVSDRPVGVVLVPLFSTDQGEATILCRRSPGLRRHAGQMAFPGGRPEKEDDGPAATALREAHEEIGLDPGLVTLVGSLPPIKTYTSNFLILPLVGTLAEEPELRADPTEVSRIVRAPLGSLRWRLVVREMMGCPVPVGSYGVDGEVIWGATYRILREVLRLWRGNELVSGGLG